VKRLGNMCELTPTEEKILVNLIGAEKGLVATRLGISVSTLDVHLSRIRRKRAKCKKFLKQTDQYKTVLYPKRKGE
jgi:DNA-directed RNA polymerase specialized sigma24 family protein